MIWKTVRSNKKEVKPPDPAYVIGRKLTEPMKELSVVNDGDHSRLLNKFYRAGKGSTLNVAFMGGSITKGYYAPPDEQYVNLVVNNLSENFTNVNCINASLPDTGSYVGVHRLDRDVLSKNPDIIFAEFSSDDSEEYTDRDKSAFENLIRNSLLSNGSPAVVVLATSDEDGKSFAQYHTEIAEKYNLPVLSYGEPVRYAINQGFIKWRDISEDSVNPNSVGHKIIAEIINDYINPIIKECKNMTHTVNLPGVPDIVTNSKYQNANIITPFDFEREDIELVYTGMFNVQGEESSGGIWVADSADYVRNSVSDEQAFKLQVKCSRLGLVYMKRPDGGIFNIKINGKQVASIDTQGESRIAAEEVYDSANTGYPSDILRNIEIVPAGNTPADSRKICVISAVLYA
jgi:lysophospholipase L1-like esterase